MSFSFQAFTEAELLATGLGNGGSLSTGDTFTIPAAASITFAGNDDDAFLSGDVSGDVARDTSGQEASIDDGSGDIGNGGAIFAELVRFAEDAAGNVYLLVQVEQNGTNDEFFTFYEGDYRGTTYALPPAGTELTLTGQSGVGRNDELAFDGFASSAAPALENIVAIAAGSDDFNILVQALSTAGLVDTIQNSTDITVFAPTDAAFTSLAGQLGYTGDTSDEGAVFGFIAQVLTDLGGGDPIPLLTDILTYHVAAGDQTGATGEVTTLQGATFTVNGTELVDNDPEAINPNVVATVAASNGVIQVIDNVLLPIDTPIGAVEPTMVEIHENDATFSLDFDTHACLLTEDVWFAAAHDKIASHIFTDSFGSMMTSRVDFTTNAAKYADLLDIDRIVNVDFGDLQTAFAGETTPELRLGETVNDGTVFEQQFFTGGYNKAGNQYWRTVDGIDVTNSWKNLRESYEDRVDAQDYTLFYEDSHGVLSSLDLKTEATSRAQQTSPIAFDLTGDGRIGTTGDSTVKGHDWNGGRVENIDLDADGVAETIEWMDGQGDGLLIDLSKVAGFTDDYRPENIDALTSQSVTKVIDGVDSVYQAPAGFTRNPFTNVTLPEGVLFDNAASRADRSNDDGITTPSGTWTYWIDITAPGVENISLSVSGSSEVKFYASDPNSTHTVDNISIGTYWFNPYGYDSTVTQDLSVQSSFWNGNAMQYSVQAPGGATSTITLSRDANAYPMRTSNDEPPHVFAPGTPDETVTETVFFDANGDELSSLTVDGTALFGDQGGAFSDGYAKLSQLEDDNGDGVVSGAELSNLAIWVDDGDARLEAGEIRSLADAGISELDTSFTVDAEGRMVSETKQDIEATGEVTYSIEGADAQFFQIDAATGELNYAAGFVPDFENPQDQGGDNIYDVTVVRTVADSVGCVKEALREDVQIKVQDKDEGPVLGSISGRYFCDTDGDGIDNNNGDEPAVEGVRVRLRDQDDRAFIATTFTDENGNYSFEGIEAGRYQVRFDQFEDKVFVDANAGSDDTVDSDVVRQFKNGVGRTATFTLGEGEDKADVDAGVEDKPESGSISGRYFSDSNRDALELDADDNPEDGVLARVVLLDGLGQPLLDGNGDVIFADTDPADGSYSFSDVPAGSYRVGFETIPDQPFVRIGADLDGDGESDDPNASDVSVSDEGGPRITLPGGETIHVETTRTFTVLAGEDKADVDGGVFKLNQPPVAEDDCEGPISNFDLYDEDTEEPLVITAHLNALDNDSDPDGDAIQIKSAGTDLTADADGWFDWQAGSDGGELRLNLDGTFQFRDAGFTFEELGADHVVETALEYGITDGNGGMAFAELIFKIEGADCGCPPPPFEPPFPPFPEVD